MAKKLDKTNIETTQIVEAWNVSQSVDALTGTDAYNISISGSLSVTGSTTIQGLLSATSGITHQLTSSNAITSSYAESVPSGVGGLWTASSAAIRRDGNVEI